MSTSEVLERLKPLVDSKTDGLMVVELSRENWATWGVDLDVMHLLSAAIK